MRWPAWFALFPIALAVVGAIFRPQARAPLSLVAAALAGAVLAQVLLGLGVERFVGLRYLHRARRPRGIRAAFLVSALVTAFGFAVFFASRGRFRAGETIGVSQAARAADRSGTQQSFSLSAGFDF